MPPELFFCNPLNRDFLLNMARHHQLAHMLHRPPVPQASPAHAPKIEAARRSPTPKRPAESAPVKTETAKKPRSNALDISNLLN
jgi:hypothetical protein